MELHPDLREFIELLNSNEVHYLVIGGYAVAFHGYPRYTGDIDFLVEVSDKNANKIVRALEEFGFASLRLHRDDFLKRNHVVQLGYAPNRIDLLTSAEAINFEDAWQKRILGLLDGVSTIFVDKESLLANKQAAGRPKDLADISQLSMRKRPKA
jgi:hypothetical protein